MTWVEDDVYGLLSWWMVDGWKEKIRKVRKCLLKYLLESWD